MTHLSSITSSHIICLHFEKLFNWFRRWFPEMVPTTVRIWIQQNSSNVSLTSSGWHHDCCSCFEGTFRHIIGWNRIWRLYWLLKFLELLKKYNFMSGALDSGAMSLTPGFTQALQCLGRQVRLLMHTSPTDRNRYILECIHFRPLESSTPGMRN